VTAVAGAGRRPGLLHSAIVVGGLRGADFLLSFLVSVLLANRFGASGQLDAFFMARRTTVGFADTIRKLVGQIVMPTVVARIDRGEGMSVRGLPPRTFLFLGGLIMLTLAGMLFPAALIGLFAPGFAGVRRDLATTMMAILMPLLPVAVIASVLMAALQANRHYLASESTTLLQRAILVLVLIVAIPPLGIVAAAWTMLAAGLIGLIALAAGAWPLVRQRRATPPAPTAIPTPAMPEQGGGVAAAILLFAYMQATSLLDFAVASRLADGSVAALEYGARLVSLVPGLVTATLSTILYPELVRAIRNSDPAVTSAALARFQRLGLFVQLPVSLGMILGADLMVRILFGHGAFGEQGIGMATATTAGYAAAAIFLTPLNATTSAIYADPRAPCLRDIGVIAGGGLLFRVAVLLWAAPRFGVAGVAWGAAVSTLLALILAQIVAVRRFPLFDIGAQHHDFARIALCGGAGAIAGAAILIWGPPAQGLIARLATLAATGLATLAGYAATAALLRLPELTTVRPMIAALVARRAGRRAR
jgi:putative peptidoglycan lipid II flippase